MLKWTTNFNIKSRHSTKWVDVNIQRGVGWQENGLKSTLTSLQYAVFYTYCYIKSVAIWDLVVDDGLYVDCLQLELYGDINKP